MMGPHDKPLLRISSVVKRFGGFTAVNDLSLDIAPGEFFALLGPSGCGKTTLLRMLAGFETPDQGAITLDGHDIAQVMPHERPINMMFQNYALFRISWWKVTSHSPSSGPGCRRTRRRAGG